MIHYAETGTRNRPVAVFCLLQFLPGSLYNEDNSGGGTKAHGPRLERGGIGENGGRILKWISAKKTGDH